MIILEGPDGGGKTKLAYRLCDEFGFTYMRPPRTALSSETGPVDPSLLAEWWYNEISMAQSGHRLRHIYDRSTYISDPLYRLMFGDESGSSDSDMARGISYLAGAALIIFCLPGWERAREALFDHSRKNLRHPEEARHKTLYWAYECQYQLWSHAAGFENVMRWDWVDYDDFRRRVKEWLDRI